jgi:hypothetical protein
MQQKSLIMFIFSMLASLSASATHYAHVTLTELQPTPQDAVWSRTKQVTPAYPVEMAMNGIAGCVVFNVNVDKNGDTESIDLVTAVPTKGIAKAVKKDLEKWQWHNITGKPNAAEQKLLRLDYCMGGNTEAEAAARCELQAKMECSE